MTRKREEPSHCPFCGEPGYVVRSQISTGRWRFVAQCVNEYDCPAPPCTRMSSRRADVVRWWNKRAKPKKETME